MNSRYSNYKQLLRNTLRASALRGRGSCGRPGCTAERGCHRPKAPPTPRPAPERFRLAGWCRACVCSITNDVALEARQWVRQQTRVLENWQTGLNLVFASYWLYEFTQSEPEPPVSKMENMMSQSHLGLLRNAQNWFFTLRTPSSQM